MKEKRKITEMITNVKKLNFQNYLQMYIYTVHVEVRIHHNLVFNNLKTNVQKLRACSYGQKLSRFPRKHFDRSNNIVLFMWRNVFPLCGKVVFIWDKNYLGHRDLACHQARFPLTGKLFVSYERKVTFHTIFVRRRDLACKLVEMFSREPR